MPQNQSSSTPPVKNTGSKKQLSNGVKLLITTQTVHKDDPALGFFHDWLKEFSKHAEHIHVICLFEGAHALPANITIHSLGKEKLQTSTEPKGKGTMIYHSTFRSFLYAVRFLRLTWKLRKEYDAVFVHMNPEHLIVSGFLWRLLKKKTGLWYTHKMVNTKLRIAEFFAHIVFTASKESFRLPSKKLRVMGHGIDTDFWTPNEHAVHGTHWLSVGRLMPVKRHEDAILLAHEAGVPLRIAGEGPEQGRLETLAQELGAQVHFLGPCTKEMLREEYRAAARFVHQSTGSLDKVVLEAASCGCEVYSTDPAISAMPLSREYVRTHHSLPLLIPRIIEAYAAVTPHA